MLPREQRLNSAAFAAAFSNGRIVRHSLVSLRVFRRESGEAGADDIDAYGIGACGAKLRSTTALGTAKHNTVKHNTVRAAFVVPKKTGKAVLRNRLRRRLRERYRLLWQGNPQRARLQNALSGCDLIFVAGQSAFGATTVQLDEAVAQLLRRAAHAVENWEPRSPGAP